MRLLFGLDRVPGSLPFDHPRLPGVEVGPAPLRLNTVPVPPAVLGDAGDGHAARLAAMQEWLQGQCGDYAVHDRGFIASYLAAVSAQIEAHRTGLAALLQGFAGLYSPEDWTWSALRPLPRAWQRSEAGPVGLGMVFWDGQRVIPGSCAPPNEFWRGEILPRSPFRRLLPAPSPVPHGEGRG